MVQKRILFIVLFCFTASFVRAQDNADACVAASGEALRVGAVFPSETVLMASAVTPYRGVVSMVTAINACGGLAGRPLELVNVPANNRESARAAVTKLVGDVSLIIGSGSPAVSEVLLDESRSGAFVYWEVSEPLDAPHQWSFSPLPNNSQLGSQTADFIQNEIPTLLADNPLRLAIIHEKRPAARQIVDALSANLATSPVLTYAYDNVLSDSYAVAKQIREKKVNVVVIVAFDRDFDQFWLSMRQADANVRAYFQVGGEPDRRNSCNRIGNSDSLMTISRTGAVADAYRLQHIGSIYDQYVASYMKQFALLPDNMADLSASGTYLLLHDILPDVVNDFTVSNLQHKIQALQLPSGSGLMGEGFTVDDASVINRAGVAIIQQRQDNRFCSLVPSEIATCTAGLLPFPTWRERVSQPQYASCVD